MLILTAPGQGSQKSGMLAPWLELPSVADRVADWSAACGLDLARLGTTASQAEITDTAITQPLIVAATLIGNAELRRRGEIPEDTVVAGHSIGEVAALAIAGVLTDEEAIILAAARGAAMSQACAERPTGMIVVLGGREADVLLSLENVGLLPANRNGVGQIVAAGPVEQIAALEQNPPTRARLRRIDVAGAFHTGYMESAVADVASVADTLHPADPRLTLLSNADGTVITDGRTALNRIVSQITNPVRWDLCTQTMLKLGVDSFLELPPSGTLVDIAKREMKTIARSGITAPKDIHQVLGHVIPVCA